MAPPGLETRRLGQVIMHSSENREIDFYYYGLLGLCAIKPFDSLIHSLTAL